jgi:hypothetical protein
MNDGLLLPRKLSNVPKSVSADTRMRSSLNARPNTASPGSACIA